MFNPILSKTSLIDTINKLEPGILGLRASPATLELRAEYIKQAAALFAAHIEEMAADADASLSAGRVDEEDARAIADIGGDLAGQIINAAEQMRECV